MGVSTDALLAYGYDLGEDIEPEWLDPESDDFAGELQNRLLAKLADFDETYPGKDGDGASFYNRQRAATERLKVEIVVHCSNSSPMYVLAAKPIHQAWRGYPQRIDPSQMLDMQEADASLAEAMTALEITPGADGPAWLLFSFWEA